MEFRTMEEAEKRMANPHNLSGAEARALSRWLGAHPVLAPRVALELSIQQIEAIERFNSTTGKLVCIQIAVAVVQVVVAIYFALRLHH